MLPSVLLGGRQTGVRTDRHTGGDIILELSATVLFHPAVLHPAVLLAAQHLLSARTSHTAACRRAKAEINGKTAGIRCRVNAVFKIIQPATLAMPHPTRMSRFT